MHHYRSSQPYPDPLPYSPCFERDPRTKDSHDKEETMEIEHERKQIKISSNEAPLRELSMSLLIR